MEQLVNVLQAMLSKLILVIDVMIQITMDLLVVMPVHSMIQMIQRLLAVLAISHILLIAMITHVR
jgi:hypothetical protein